MKAAIVAAALKAHGITATEILEGTDNEDGMVAISATVHVQVPTFGRKLGVVHEKDGLFNFFKMRPATDLGGIIKDIVSTQGV